MDTNSLELGRKVMYKGNKYKIYVLGAMNDGTHYISIRGKMGIVSNVQADSLEEVDDTKIASAPPSLIADDTVIVENTKEI